MTEQSPPPPPTPRMYQRPASLGQPSKEKVEEIKEIEAIDTQTELQLAGLAGTKTLLAAPPGAGKTFSLVTSIKAGLELFVLGTEPNFEESLLEAIDFYKLDRRKLHYAYAAPAAPSWDDLSNMAREVNAKSYEDIAKIKQGVAKQGHRQFLDMLSLCKNFKDQRGQEFGAVDDWGPDRMFVVDSLSGVNEMAMGLTIGAKPAAHQGEWGVAMNVEDKFLMKLCADTRCFVCVTAHVERVMDEVIGRPIMTAAALGNKLAPKIPRRFSDFVLAQRSGSDFTWSTTNTNMDLKARTLPFSDKLPPSFETIVAKWKERRLASQRQAEEDAVEAAAQAASVTNT